MRFLDFLFYSTLKLLENDYYNFSFASDDFSRYIYPLFYTLHHVKKVPILKTNFKTNAIKY